MAEIPSKKIEKTNKIRKSRIPGGISTLLWDHTASKQGNPRRAKVIRGNEKVKGVSKSLLKKKKKRGELKFKRFRESSVLETIYL